MHDARKDFIERLGILMETEGLPRIAGRFFGALLLASEPVSLDDLAVQLDVSKASISVNARLLEHRGLLERVSQPGDRRDFYRASSDLFRRSMEHRLARWRAFHEIVTDMQRSGARLESTVQTRLGEITAAYEHILDAITGVLDKWNRRTARPSAPHRAPAGRSK